MTVCLDTEASQAIFALAHKFKLRDSYASAPGARGGEYVGVVAGKPFACRVYDNDPLADLLALRAALAAAVLP